MATFEQLLADANDKTATIQEMKGLLKEASDLRMISKDILGDIDKRRLILSPADRKQIDFLDAERAQLEHMLSGEQNIHYNTEYVQSKLNETIEKIDEILGKYN